jgi:integrase
MLETERRCTPWRSSLGIGWRRRGRPTACHCDNWFGWCAENGVDPLDATRSQIEIFARELEATGRKLATVASKLNALAGFYRYAVIDGVLDRDPMLNVRRPRVERVSSTQGLTRTEFADASRARAARSRPSRCHTAPPGQSAPRSATEPAAPSF